MKILDLGYAEGYIPPIGLRAPLKVARSRQTYRNVLYLLGSLPLGVAYFTFLAVGFSLGFSLLFVLVGVPILALVGVGWWKLAAFERELAMWWLRVEIPPMLAPGAKGVGTARKVRAYLTSQLTWTSLAYLLVKLPLGAVSFGLAFAAIWVCAWLFSMPVALLLRAIHDGGFGLGSIVPAVLSPLLAVAVGLGALYLLNALALASGLFARVMLGASDTALRLAESEALAERQTAKADRAEQSRRELIVNASHELRTPVASIRGHVDSLLLSMDGTKEGSEGAAQSPPPAELRSYLAIVQRESERLGSLVDELLSLARAEEGELRLRIEPVDAASVVEEVYETLAPLARRDREVTLVREVAQGLPPVLADRQRLAQVLLNLTRNAITYTPAGGIVSIGLARSGPDHVALTVSDTGAGIAPEDLERVFDRFYRTDESRTRASGGFGLGLAIVRDLVRAMGGAVSAESTLGGGSSFRVTLKVMSNE